MTAVQLGPFVMSTPRFAAILGLLVFLVAAQILERRRSGLAAWAWTSALLVVIGARLGFVLENLGTYLREPLTILYFWQGGFSPIWGLALALGHAVWRVGAGMRARAAQVALLGLVAWGGVLLLLSPADLSEVRLPDTPLQALGGSTTDLDHVAAGRPVVLNLWAPWCPPCRRETPMIVDAAASHPDIPFVLADQASSADEVAEFLAEHGLAPDDFYLDRSARLGSELRSVGLPTTFFFGADGELVHTHAGEISRAELERRVRSLHDRTGTD